MKLEDDMRTTIETFQDMWTTDLAQYFLEKRLFRDVIEYTIMFTDASGNMFSIIIDEDDTMYFEVIKRMLDAGVKVIDKT